MDVFKEKHIRIDEKFDTHEKRLNNHGDGLEKQNMQQILSIRKNSYK
jgi:hypothetical protein